ncbi:DUF6909 family protein [Desulforhabdus amnigena]|uniref:Uncharacterized protein n=1 Tax=Desulforhabdus amnigena TaxID=40218 RepID=A0A9W6D0G3_9BACT|nr:hypothetical protein [Deltaproteobacteria bacterium]GLI33757.1 hypothetical protein DAMNIGENAA_11900 [Desulforhabdus amnigena]
MEETTRSHAARLAIRNFRIAADALLLIGRFKMEGRSGQVLQDSLKTLSPEIYGTMNDPKSIELKGLEYVMDRLPRGIEECCRFVMTSEEDLGDTPFVMLQPLKRRRTSYRINEKEMCFVITRGFSEIYDILTHLTFLYIEAKNIHSKMRDQEGNLTTEWKEFDKFMETEDELDSEHLNRAIWNLSIILGRTFHETKDTYEYFDRSKKEMNASNGLFKIIHSLGTGMGYIVDNQADVEIQFTPDLSHVILHQMYGKRWAAGITDKLLKLNLENRPLHIISSNLHSVVNLLYGYAAVGTGTDKKFTQDLYTFVQELRNRSDEIREYARNHGFYEVPDKSGAHIDCQIIDTANLNFEGLHPDLRINVEVVQDEKPVVLVMDYAFGTQAFELIDSLLQPMMIEGEEKNLNLRSISVMGKAGTLRGKKGDIMIPTAHVLEGSAHNYILDNDLTEEDFDGYKDVFVGPMITVLGTSLQNRDVLETFKTTSWKAVGLEMEGGHYHRAINAAMIREHISKDVKVRYAYYASDNPLKSGQTLASGSLGIEGIKPTYMITKRILEKIL